MIRLAQRLTVLTLFSTLAATALAQEPGQWAHRAELLAPNSEFAVAELDGRLHILGGYPADRVTVRTAQVYDIAADRWEMGPELPAPNNHGMAVGVNGKIYLIGGQTEAEGDTYVDTVYELDPAVGEWVEKAKMPTRRSADDRRTGTTSPSTTRRPTAGNRCPICPVNAITSRVRRSTGASTSSAAGLEEASAPARQPPTRYSIPRPVAAPMLRPRSGINGVLADGCLHAWGGESAAGMFPDHDYYDPRSDSSTKLPDMPLPVHGVTGSAFVNGLIHAPGGGTEVGGSSGGLHNQVYRPAVSCQ